MKIKKQQRTFALMRVLSFIFCLLLSSLAHAVSYEIFSQNGKMGIKNDQGQVVVPAAFEALGWSDGSFSVISNTTGYRKDDRWGILNLKNEFITQADFESLVYAGADNIIARKKINAVQSKSGCINLRGEIKIPFQYDGITVNGLRAIVFNLSQAKYQYGLVDLTNKSLIPVKYRSIRALGTLRYAVEDEHGKIALFGEDGRAVTDFEIDSISMFSYSKAIVYENLKQGVIDREGQIKLKPVYRDIVIESDEKARVRPSSEWLFIDEKNHVVQQIEADEITPVSENTFKIKLSDKFGLLDNQLKTICPMQYSQLDRFAAGKYLARLNKKTGVISRENDILVPFRYDSLMAEQELLRGYQRIEGWSLLNTRNQTLTTKYYDWIGPQADKLFPVINNHYWGAINEKGEEVVHCVFDSLVQIEHSLLVVKFKSSYGIINAREDWLLAPQPLPITLVNSQIYSQEQFGNTMLKKLNGEVFYFTNNRLEFHKDFFVEYLPDGTEKTIDYNGQLVERIAPPQVTNVERIFPMSEGFRGIKRDDKFGFIDERGRLRIANRYDDIGEFHEGLAAFKLIGRWGFINTIDQVVINPNYDNSSQFRDGLAIVSRNGKFGVIDKKGIAVLKFQYDSIQYLSDKKFRLYSNGLSGLADETGSILIDPRFDQLQLLGNSLVLVGTSGKYGVLTISGMSVVPIIYDSLRFDKDRNQFIALKKSDWKTIDIK